MTMRGHFEELKIKYGYQITRVHLLYRPHLNAKPQKDEYAWYDPVGDHSGHYDIDGVSQYHDIDERGEKASI